MTTTFLPGEPNCGLNCVDSTQWDNFRVVVYCSGNNLIILEDTSTLLQTIYLKGDGRAVKIDPESGRIAVSFGRGVLVLQPVLIYDKPLKWEELCTVTGGGDDVSTLGWSTKDELVAGSECLTLWNLQSCKSVWKKKLAGPIHQLKVSPDSTLIATIGKDDRLVKVWRRSSFDSQYTQFDFIYLSHPRPVEKLEWRTKSTSNSNSSENLLYTFSRDNIMRLWMSYDSMDGGNLRLWGSVDVNYENAFIVDNMTVSRSIENAIKQAGGSRNSPTISDAIKLGQRKSDFCVTISGNTVSIYAIESLGSVDSKHHKRLINVTKVMEKPVLVNDYSRNLHFIPYPPNPKLSDNGQPDLSLLVHDRLGRTIYHYTLNVKWLFTRGREKSWVLKTILTGHNKSVQSIGRGNDGQSLLSKSRFDENYVWKPKNLANGMTLKRTSLIQGEILRGTLIEEGNFVVTLMKNTYELVLWDCRLPEAKVIYRLPTGVNEDPLCFFLPPEEITPSTQQYHHLVAVYSFRNIKSWRICLPNGETDSKFLVDMGVFGITAVTDNAELVIAQPIDPVGWSAKIDLDFFDPYQRDVLTTISKAGTIRTWTAQIRDDNNNKGTLEWLETGKIETGVESIRQAEVSSTRKVATTNYDSTKLCIWDARFRLLEFEQTFDDRISDLDWTSAPGGQSVLGVGFASRKVVLYCQLRFDYTNDVPAWAPFKRVDISPFTNHPIGDSIWLKDGAFVVGSGNQLFIQDNKIDPNDSVTSQILDSRMSDDIKGGTIFDACAILNGPLPFYHPQLLIQCIFAGKMDVVKKILVNLLKQLKFSPEITSDLDIPDVFNDTNNGRPLDEKQRLFRRNSFADHNDAFDEAVAQQLSEWMQKVSLPYLTRHQQITLVSVIEALAQTDIHRRSLDENGVRFLVGFKLYKVHPRQDSMTIRDFNWALHSESQDILVQLVEKSSNGPMLWPAMRDVGYAYWLRSEKLAEQFEIVARNSFNHEGKRDPTACTLYYLALRKKPILVGLWKTAAWHREQTKTIKLLSNDFTQSRWRSAALKNAFALLGKHRFEYAAAFFLLGDSLKDAVGVIIKNMRDISLAIAVARVYDRHDEKGVLRDIITNHIFPTAKEEGDRWTMSWSKWMLHDKAGAIQDLAFGQHQHPSQNLLSKKQAKLFLVDDPVLVVLYRYLRDRSLKTTDSGGTGNYEGLDVGNEFDFLIKTTYIYAQMGCEVLGLDLVKNWKFIRQSTKTAPTPPQDEQIPPRLKRRPTLVSIDSTLGKDSINGDKSDGGIMKDFKPVSAQAFQEPDMSAFDFGY